MRNMFCKYGTQTYARLLHWILPFHLNHRNDFTGKILGRELAVHWKHQMDIYSLACNNANTL